MPEETAEVNMIAERTIPERKGVEPLEDVKAYPPGVKKEPATPVFLAGMSREMHEAFGEESDFVVGELGLQTERVVKAIGTQTVDVLYALGGEETKKFANEVKNIHTKSLAEINAMRSSLLESRGSIKVEVADDPEMKTVFQKLNLEIAELSSQQARYSELMESQIPDALKVPMASKLGAEAGRAFERRSQLGVAITRNEGETNTAYLNRIATVLPEVISVSEYAAWREEVENDEGVAPEDKEQVLADRVFKTLLDNSGDVGERARRMLERVENDYGNDEETRDNIQNDLINFWDTDRQYSSKLYQQGVSDWFETQLRRVETSQHSVERNEILPRLSTALTFLRYKDGTRSLARELERDFVARFRKQNLVQAWNFSPADALMEAAVPFTLKDQKEVFTHTKRDELADFASDELSEELESSTPIAEEFLVYEAMGRRLKRARKGGANDDGETENVEDIEDEIRDYFHRGGVFGFTRARDGEMHPVYVEDMVENLEREHAETGETDESLLGELRENLWARRSAGELWSITGRAGEHSVVLNGLADLHMGRIMHITKEFEEKDVYSRTSGLWGKYVAPGETEAKMFDLGMSDYIEGFLLDDDERKNLEEKDELPDLGSEEFWDGKIHKDPGRGKGKLGIGYIDAVGKAHQDVKKLRGPEGFLQKPSNEMFQAMKKERIFEHLSENFVKGGSKYGGGQATEREEKIAEFLDRVLMYASTSQSWELLEPMKLYRDSEIKEWIDQAEKNDGVAPDQSRFLYKKHLNLPILSRLSPKTAAEIRARFHTAFIGVPREFKIHLVTSTAWETFKRWLAFIFSE